MLGAAGGRASYVGYSLGGRICLTLALEDPETVERLVLVGATPGIADADERALRRTADEALADRLDPPPGAGRQGLTLETFLDEWLAGPLFAHLSAEQADRPLALRTRRQDSRGRFARRAPVPRCRAMTASANCRCRCCSSRAEHDEKFSAIANEMAASIGDNATAFIDGVPDTPPFEAPDAFATTLEGVPRLELNASN